MAWVLTIVGLTWLIAATWFSSDIYGWGACPPIEEQNHCNQTFVIYLIMSVFVYPAGILLIGLAGLVNWGPLGNRKFGDQGK